MANAQSGHITAMDSLVGQFDELLTDLSGEYGRLLETLAEHREAVRTADGTAIAATAGRHASIIQSIANLERRRRQVVNDVEGIISLPRLGRPVTLTDIARHMPGPIGTRLVAKASDLRELMGKVQAQNTTLKAAAGSLLAHIEGIVRQVGRQLSQAGTYSQRGRVESALVTTALDLRT